MTVEDGRALPQLQAIFGERVAPRARRKPADPASMAEARERSREVNEEFARRLMAQADRPLRERREWILQEDRRQEGRNR